MGPTTVFFKHLKDPKICMKPRFLREIFISKARKKFFPYRMGMFKMSRSKSGHQTLRSKKNHAHTTRRSKDMDETKKSGTKKKSSLDPTVIALKFQNGFQL